MNAFAELHRAGEPLLLPTAWDHASARLFAAQGFPAIGTTSLGVAAGAGLPDGAAATRDETMRLALALGAEPFLLSVDAEGGFGDDPDEVAQAARELAVVGVAGINLEDGLGPARRHAEKIAAVKAAAPGLFVNARTDTYWLGDGEGTRRRLEMYRQAGADGLFVPGLTDPAEIAALVRDFDGTPLNVSYAPGGPGVTRLTDLGVRRISLGSLLYRRALGAAVDALADIRAGRRPGGFVPSYEEVRALSDQRGAEDSKISVSRSANATGCSSAPR
ncbi:isocitrate lyase/phosphoenolpyruvate mutase family protein [Streptomyces sp. JB150]|uniref:isocitrate lyase/PEP mutase family protein n=1 Tax=Streptomyces sp. JB150 TaxID=2714844 RepID=UPI00140B2F30|nr:isocitrate lyase/phosphoenolpyruvate mutase family protein [Streptomyces sp. JB150]QIJ65402.1 isocitrate lyase/phosphoenolpyruvate mutase family protein [Streptomyces sp. JB150]